MAPAGQACWLAAAIGVTLATAPPLIPAQTVYGQLFVTVSVRATGWSVEMYTGSVTAGMEEFRGVAVKKYCPVGLLTEVLLMARAQVGVAADSTHGSGVTLCARVGE